jgi:hypothetical protein
MVKESGDIDGDRHVDSANDQVDDLFDKDHDPSMGSSPPQGA